MKTLMLFALVLSTVFATAQSTKKIERQFLNELNQVLKSSQTIHWAYQGKMVIDSAFAINKRGILSVTVHFEGDSSFVMLRQEVPMINIEQVTQDVYVIFKCTNNASLAFMSDTINGPLKPLGGENLFFIGEWSSDEQVLDRIQYLLEQLKLSGDK